VLAKLDGVDMDAKLCDGATAAMLAAQGVLSAPTRSLHNLIQFAAPQGVRFRHPA
jgi:hypothetical protein